LPFLGEPVSAAREDRYEAGADDNGEAGVLAEVEVVPDEAGAEDGGVLTEVEAGAEVVVVVGDVVGDVVGEVVGDVVGLEVGVVDVVGVGVGVGLTVAGGGV
jgi:hypothetical protein